MSPSASVPMQDRIARFELRHELGRGAQATVWLAFDPQLQREVALKLIHPDAEASSVDAWLHEARLMATLTHPGIVTVHEAGRDGDRPFLVLERVEGPTLAQRLRDDGAMNAREAACLMIEVLDALAFAHQRGVVHRDLKPSNVLLCQRGRPHVMDFGIAARVAAAHDGRIVGTPGYISPEAAAGLAPQAAMDLYSAGMLLGHVLLGRPLRQERDPMRALRRAIDEDVSWPEDDTVTVDDGLRSIVLRAAARDPARRFPDATAMRQALEQWLKPAPVVLSDGGHGTLDFLLRRMRLNGDFPALSDSVSRIQKVVSSEDGSLQALSAEILKDVALTHKLLRLVNTAHFRRSRAGEVNTVSRAAALVGFAAIRNMALSVLLLEHMHNRGHAERMRGLFLRALLTATLNDELTPPSREREEAFLAGMLSHLGRLLVAYYFPDEAAQISQRLETPECPDGEAERLAAREVLGLDYEDLGQGVAKVWDLPESQRELMRVPSGEVPRRLIEHPAERMRWRIRLAGEMVASLLGQEPEAAQAHMAELAQRYARALDLHADDIIEAVKSARVHLAELAASLRISVGTAGRDKRLLGDTTPAKGAAAGAATAPAGSAQAPAAPAGVAGPRPDAGPPRELLAAGIAEITSSLAADSFRLNEVLRLILSTMFKALGFGRVVFCLRDPATGLLTGRFGLGQGADELCKLFRVDVRAAAPSDLFAAACLKGVDTLIADGRAASLAPRLPAWYRGVAARSFLLLPLTMKSAPFALIYADTDEGPALSLDETELGMLRTLRNQAVMAFKTAA